MTRGIWIAAIIIAGLFALLRYFPLAWAASFAPDNNATYSGTIWNGQISGLPLVDRMNVKTTLSGVALESGAAAGATHVRAIVSPSRARDLVAAMPISAIPTTDGRLKGLSGQLSLRLDEIVGAGDACTRASGRASTNVLESNRAQFDWTGPLLSGPVDCDDGKLRVRLNGVDDSQSIAVTILTGFSGQYEANVEVQTPDPMAANVMTLFGFSEQGQNRFNLSEQGRWR